MMLAFEDHTFDPCEDNGSNLEYFHSEQDFIQNFREIWQNIDFEGLSRWLNNHSHKNSSDVHKSSSFRDLK